MYSIKLLNRPGLRETGKKNPELHSNCFSQDVIRAFRKESGPEKAAALPGLALGLGLGLGCVWAWGLGLGSGPKSGPGSGSGV